MSKELTRPCVNRLIEPSWIVTEWDESMALIITGRHLYVGSLTVAGIGTEQGMRAGFKQLSTKGKVHEAATPMRG